MPLSKEHNCSILLGVYVDVAITVQYVTHYDEKNNSEFISGFNQRSQEISCPYFILF